MKAHPLTGTSQSPEHVKKRVLSTMSSLAQIV